MFKVSIRVGQKCDLRDLTERVMAVGVSQTVILGFSHSVINRVYREWSEKQYIQ